MEQVNMQLTKYEEDMANYLASLDVDIIIGTHSLLEENEVCEIDNEVNVIPFAFKFIKAFVVNFKT